MPFPFRSVLISGALTTVAVAAHAQGFDAPQPLDPPQLIAENGDENPVLTPMDQGTSTEDVRMTQSVRQALTNDEKLSINAQNVKIITRDGVVTLRGQVNDAQEKAAVVTAAKRVAGVKRVDDQLTTEPMGGPKQPPMGRTP